MFMVWGYPSAHFLLMLLSEFVKMWYEHPLRHKDQLIRSWRSDVKVSARENILNADVIMFCRSKFRSFQAVQASASRPHGGNSR